MALTVMVYHITGWSGVHPPGWAWGAFQKAGFYAVCAFFVISGYSLQWTYGDVLKRETILEYFRRRWLRIAPLFLVALAATACLHRAPFRGPDAAEHVGRILWNASLLFGFTAPGAVSIVTGGWSIGVEWVFYVFFPALVFVCRNDRLRLGAAAGLSVVASILWSAVRLDPSRPLGDQWNGFISPVHYGFYFVGGMALAALARDGPLRRLPAAAGIAASVALFLAVLPHPREDARMLHGWPWAALALSTLALVGFVGRLEVRGRPLRILCELLGQSSYALYLLHPLVWVAACRIVSAPAARIALTAALAIPFSLVVYRWFERPLLRLGSARKAPGEVAAAVSPAPPPRPEA